MKLDGFDWAILSIPIVLTILIGTIAYDDQQERITFQQTYNKNLECRQELKDQTMARVNDICGPVPQIKDFTGGN